MPIIGQPGRVAIEFELRETSEDVRSWLFGKICIWAAGQRIGRHDEECALTVALTTFPFVLADAGRRRDVTLLAMPAAEAFARIHAAIYEEDSPDRSYADTAKLVESFRRFEVLPNGFDAFDGWNGYLIEDRMVGRLVWRGPDGAVQEARIGAGEFDRAIDGFLSALEQASGQKRVVPDR
jgi:hypothetical protein